jgi:hypothetical protein
MNRVITVLLFMVYCCALLSQEPPAQQAYSTLAVAKAAKASRKAGPQERWFFPQRNWIYGFVEFDIAPPHNEPDPNLCAPNAAAYGGANSLCDAFARYVMQGQVEIRPFGKSFLRRIKFFAMPTFLFGKSVPQFLYTWSMDPIGWERQWGASVYLGQRVELRVTQHFMFESIGTRDLGPGYLGPNGPWGRSTLIGVRKYFGYPSVRDEAVR